MSSRTSMNVASSPRSDATSKSGVHRSLPDHSHRSAPYNGASLKVKDTPKQNRSAVVKDTKADAMNHKHLGMNQAPPSATSPKPTPTSLVQTIDSGFGNIVKKTTGNTTVVHADPKSDIVYEEVKEQVWYCCGCHGYGYCGPWRVSGYVSCMGCDHKRCSNCKTGFIPNKEKEGFEGL